MMSAVPLGVAIVTNGRCPELLDELVRAWERLGLAVHMRVNTRPDDFNADLNLVVATFPEDHAVLTTDDDVLPVSDTWGPMRAWQADAITAVRAKDVEGRRTFDWATWDARFGPAHKGYDVAAGPLTYISNYCQVWGPEARRMLTRPPGRNASTDINICRLALATGVKLLPPDPEGPMVIHLERRWPK